MKGAIFGAALAVAATSASGDTIPETLARIEGAVVEFSGEIIIEITGANRIRVPDVGYFPFDMAVAPAVLRQVMECPASGFGRSRCTADFTAEIHVDGSVITLIVFEVRNLVVP